MGQEDTTDLVDSRSGTSARILESKEKCPSDDDKENEKITQTKQEEISTVVPDGGWGWLVAFGGFIITMLLSSLGPCFGILFSKYLLELGASSVLTAWIFNTQLFIWHLMGPLVRPLSTEFGWRPVGLAGVLLCAASIIISAFSPSAGFLFFSFSLLSGTWY
ncbi:hypothetical protein SK128_011141 [Halocaridina rubra]|uniref:Major facilitator superfamily (MFS) profile domain-containing protein n=1 Tax=Halocaridina rubra TaxID=373956 RepID=A0AAN8X2X4_HALRR